MLYVFTVDNGVMVSNVDPDDFNPAIPDDDANNFQKVEAEGFVIPFPANHKTPLDVEANIIRNKLSNGGAKVTIR